ncbi:MAG: ethanolamine utilization microcompartment protein EutL [Pseudomonadota bacterium]
MLASIPLTVLKPKVLIARLIPAPHGDLAKALGHKGGGPVSYGLLSSDREHSLFVALDEATKASPVSVIYARALYAGSVETSGPFSGEAIGILAGADDEIVREGLKSAVRTLEESAFWYATASASPIPFFPKVISSLGEYLAREAGLPPGEPMAYLMAPPVESVVAVDAALKAAQVRLIKYFGPPTETNRGGAYLTGPLEECEAAARAFSEAVVAIAENPVQAMDRVAFAPRTSRKS